MTSRVEFLHLFLVFYLGFVRLLPYCLCACVTTGGRHTGTRSGKRPGVTGVTETGFGQQEMDVPDLGVRRSLWSSAPLSGPHPQSDGVGVLGRGVTGTVPSTTPNLHHT